MDAPDNPFSLRDAFARLIAKGLVSNPGDRKGAAEHFDFLLASAQQTADTSGIKCELAWRGLHVGSVYPRHEFTERDRAYLKRLRISPDAP